MPQVLLAAEALKQGFQVLRAALPAEKTESLGKVMLATVAGDIHDLGKNIVAALLENNGFEIVDLGKDVPAARIVDEAEARQAAVIGLSALMTTTMVRMEDTVRLVRERGLATRIMVGGAVVTRAYADMIGAHGYADDAVAAVRVVTQLCAEARQG